MSFNDLQLIEPVLKALHDEGYTMPTPVQQQAIPVILQHKDLLGCAQTGTGKTAAFAIPLLQLLHLHQQAGNHQPRSVKALILAPTRELSIQIDESIKAYGKYLNLKHLVIFGGVSQYSQVNALRSGVDILVATPGRLLDLLNQRHLTLSDIKFFVLDEADRMLDMGFVQDVRRIIARLPQQRQTLFFSATMPPQIQHLADTLLKQPVKVEVAPPATTAELIEQSVYFTEKHNKPALLVHLLKEESIKRVLVFAKTKYGADKVARNLHKAGISAEAIHGDKSQGARQRALHNFKLNKTRVLVATDIAARGIDIDELSHVINYELPNVPETYVHRIGRTGRAGAGGIAISFCDFEEKIFLKDIQRLVNKVIPVVKGHPYDAPLMYAAATQPATNNTASHSGWKSGGGRKGRRVFLQQAR